MVFIGTPPPKREWDEFGSIRHADIGDRLGVKNPYRSLGFVILAKQGGWDFFGKKQGQMTLQLHRIWIYTVIDFFWLPQGCCVFVDSQTQASPLLATGSPKRDLKVNFATVILMEIFNKMVGDHRKQMGWHLTVPKKCTVLSLPNTSWEGVLGMFLGPKHVSMAFRGFVWLWVLGSVYNLVGGFNPSEKYWSNWIKNIWNFQMDYP